MALALLEDDDMKELRKYDLRAKRPHEKVFTDWCKTDDYEAIKRNIKIIEGYGWQWELKEKT